MSSEKIEYEWQELLNRGVSPPIRYNTAPSIYNGELWLILGAGAGVGRCAEVWKFSLTALKWTNIVCKGEIPSCRDGHSVTYIGDGKFVLFGGQGYPYPNEKSEKITDVIKVKTYLVREVYNTLYELDCATLTWKTLQVDGASLPMGRRGHTAVYVHSQSQLQQPRKLSRKQARLEAMKSDFDKIQIEDRSLLVFGGAGIEPSKYTEILYNDLWMYSFDTGRWKRLITNGIEPRPIFDHKAVVVNGCNWVIVGGITGTTSAQKLMTLQESMTLRDVMILNMRTLTWSYVDIETKGRPTYLRLHGHSLAQDPQNNNKLIIFGGKETVDLKRAAIESVPKSFKSKSFGANVWMLDLTDGSVEPLPISGDPLENRYGHVGVSMADVGSTFLDREHMRLAGKDENSYHSHHHHNHHTSGGSVASGIANSHQNSPSQSTTHDKERDKSSRNGGDAPRSVKVGFEPCAEPLMIIFGGTRVDDFGMCDAVVSKLVRVHSLNDEASLALGTKTGAGELGGFPDDASSFSRAGSRNPSFLNSPTSQVSGLVIGESAIEEGDDQSSLSEKKFTIWQKRNMPIGYASIAQNVVTKSPTCWEDLKLAITYPVSEKITLATESRKQMLLHNSGSKLGHSSSMGSLPHIPGQRGMQNSSSVGSLGFGSGSHGGHGHGHGHGSRVRHGAASLGSLGSNHSQSVTESSHGGRGGSFLGGGDGENGVGSHGPPGHFAKREDRIRGLKQTLSPIVRGLTLQDAKEEFWNQFPPPDIEQNPFKIVGVGGFNRKFAPVLTPPGPTQFLNTSKL